MLKFVEETSFFIHQPSIHCQCQHMTKFVMQVITYRSTAQIMYITSIAFGKMCVSSTKQQIMNIGYYKQATKSTEKTPKIHLNVPQKRTNKPHMP